MHRYVHAEWEGCLKNFVLMNLAATPRCNTISLNGVLKIASEAMPQVPPTDTHQLNMLMNVCPTKLACSLPQTVVDTSAAKTMEENLHPSEVLLQLLMLS